MVARSLGILHKAIFDAWAAHDAAAKPVKSSVPRRPVAQRIQANKDAAIGAWLPTGHRQTSSAMEPTFAAKLSSDGD